MFGIAITVGLFIAADPLLESMGTPVEVFRPAKSYLLIRAIASPAVMLTNVAYGALLGQQNAITPLKICALAGLINLVVDVYLILELRMACTGAAIGTALSQYVGCAVFLAFLWVQGRKGKVIPLTWEGFPTIAAVKPFVGVAATLLSRTMFGMACYLSISAAANSLGSLSASIHQVSMQMFWFLSFFPEPLSVAA